MHHDTQHSSLGSLVCMFRQYKEEYHATAYVYNSLLQLYVSIITIP